MVLQAGCSVTESSPYNTYLLGDSRQQTTQSTADGGWLLGLGKQEQSRDGKEAR